MTALDCDCPPLDGVNVCSPLPLAFVRLRYFFGKRLNVADFVDEQLYHGAKMRFHNQHLHGAGVVCGLRVSPLGSNGGGAAATGVRVGKGAALDRCGREIVVGFNQCIDVDAWIARELQARKAIDPKTTFPKSEDPDDDDKITLCVVLRYDECSSSPEPAPRNPCVCDNGGCDFGRIREGFELDLRTQAQVVDFVAPLAAPAPAALSGALGEVVSGQGFLAALAGLVTAPAAEPSSGEWLVIGCIEVTLSAQQKVTEVKVLPAPLSPFLLETAALQDILLRALGAGFEPGALVDKAPQVLAVALASDAGASKAGANNVVTLTLSGPIVEGTLPEAATVNALDATGWIDVPPPGGKPPKLAAGVPVKIEIPIGDVSAARRYRLSLPSAPATPICDEKMRPLLPLRFAWAFAVDAAGNVTGADFA